MTDKEASFTFRVEADLKVAFVAACKGNDQTAAQVLRAAMRDYLKAWGPRAVISVEERK